MNYLECDSCGKIHRETPDFVMCPCGRVAMRMDWADDKRVIAHLEAEIGSLSELLRCHHDEPCTSVVLRQDSEIARIRSRLQTIWDETAPDGMHPRMTTDWLIDAIERELNRRHILLSNVASEGHLPAGEDATSTTGRASG